jgi:hypothetical protein
VPVLPLVLAVMDLAPLVLKNPLSVVKVTAVPSAAGVPAEVIKAAVMVVELAPSANSDICPAVSVMPTTGLAAGGGVDGVEGDGVVLGGVVLAGGVLGALVLGGDSWPCCPPPPAF